mmetsp:Transcript_116700/g.238714  ORF Transcript_116700/g.238714 Transcript_116700/m.238714 type:complete len:230 (+) Transcript_116700:1868-2557(+)
MRDMHVRVGAKGIVSHSFMPVVAITPCQLSYAHNMRSLSMWKSRSPDEAFQILPDLTWRNGLEHLQLRRILEDPRQESQVLALGIELESEMVGTKDQHLPLRGGQHNRFQVEVAPGMECDGIALVVDEVHEAQLPPLNKVQVPFHHAALDIFKTKRVLRQRLTLFRRGEGQPNHALSAAKRLKTHGIPSHRAHDCEQVGDILVVLRISVRRRLFVPYIVDAEEQQRIQL